MRKAETPDGFWQTFINAVGNFENATKKTVADLKIGDIFLLRTPDEKKCVAILEAAKEKRKRRVLLLKVVDISSMAEFYATARLKRTDEVIWLENAID